MDKPVEVSEVGNVPTVESRPSDFTGENGWAILGGLRFVLAMIVLLGHTADFGGRAGLESRINLANALDPTAAVFAFLIISGYSMAHSIENPRGFYRRRFWRIVPLYVFGLIFGYLVTVLAHGRIIMPGNQTVEKPDIFSLIANLLFLQGWVVQRLLINGPLWSISTEVFYYLLTPLLARCRVWAIAVMCCISIVAFCKSDGNYWEPYWGGGMLQLAWLWLGGFLLYRNFSGITRILLVGVSCLMTKCESAQLAPTTVTFSALIVSSAGGIPVSRRLRNILNYLGELSYPLYVIHWPTILGMYAIAHVSDLSAWIAASLTMAVLVYHVVDQPIRRRKKNKRKEIPIAAAVVAQPVSPG